MLIGRDPFGYYFYTEKKETKMGEFDVTVLKDAVTNLLITQHDMLPDEAEETVKESYTDKPNLWVENADAKALAKFLASDDDDE